MRANGWEVKSSPYYNDPATNKPREIDIVAKKKIRVVDRAGDNEHHIVVELFIECKHISSSNVLWFEHKNMPAATQLAKNNHILRRVEDVDLTVASTYPPLHHHYLREEGVAKRWDKNGHSDPLYEAMNGVLNGQIFFQDHHLPGERYVVDFPIIVVDSYTNLHKRDLTNSSGYTDITKNFQIEVDYSYTDKDRKSKTGYFLVDVVDKAGLGAFLADLETSDFKILKTRLASDLLQSALAARQAQVRNNQRYNPFSSM